MYFAERNSKIVIADSKSYRKGFFREYSMPLHITTLERSHTRESASKINHHYQQHQRFTVLNTNIYIYTRTNRKKCQTVVHSEHYLRTYNALLYYLHV